MDVSWVLPHALGVRLRRGEWRVTDRAAWHVRSQPSPHMMEVCGVGSSDDRPMFVWNDCVGTTDVLLFGAEVVLADTLHRRVTRLTALVNVEEYVRWRAVSREFVSQPQFLVDPESRLVTEEMVGGRRLVSKRSRRNVTMRLLNDADRWTSHRLQGETVRFSETPLFAWYQEHSDHFDGSTQSAFESLAEEPSLVSHSDLSPWNIIVTDDAGGYCVIDWSESPIGELPAWFDLATVAITSGATREFQGFLSTRPWLDVNPPSRLTEAWSAVAIVKKAAGNWRKSGRRFTVPAQQWSEWAMSYVNRTRDVA